MKTLKLLIVGFLFTLSSSAFANDEKTTSEMLRMDYPVKTYIDAICHGKIKDFSKVLDQDAKFTMTRGQKIINYGRYEVLNSLKNTENIEQNCSAGYQVMEITPNQAVVKVTMKYPHFSRVNFISLANTTKGWKITNVSSSFI